MGYASRSLELWIIGGRFPEGTRMMKQAILMACTATMALAAGGTSATPSAPAAPTADDITITVAPGDSVLIPYSGSDPDGDLFGFHRTSGLGDPAAGFMLESCVCLGTYAGTLCSCTTFFTADAGFAGGASFTYRAVDLAGNESADATVTIQSTVQTRTPEQILDEIEFIVVRGTFPGGDIDEQLRNPLLTMVDGIRTKLGDDSINAALGEAGALCNLIDAGTQSLRIEVVAAADLPALCAELTNLLKNEPCDCQILRVRVGPDRRSHVPVEHDGNNYTTWRLDIPTITTVNAEPGDPFDVQVRFTVPIHFDAHFQLFDGTEFVGEFEKNGIEATVPFRETAQDNQDLDCLDQDHDNDLSVTLAKFKTQATAALPGTEFMLPDDDGIMRRWRVLGGTISDVRVPVPQRFRPVIIDAACLELGEDGNLVRVSNPPPTQTRPRTWRIEEDFRPRGETAPVIRPEGAEGNE